MEAQKCLRNSGFLPPLAADGVYDHNCAVPSTVRHAGQAQERLALTTCIRLLFRTDTNDLAGGVRRGKGERVETRHPPACCLWPRSRHRPAAAKAVSLLSGVVPANRECRSATRLCYRCGDECVCLPNWVRRMRVAPCGEVCHVCYGEGVGRRLLL